MRWIGLILFFISTTAYSQAGYKTGDRVKDFPIKKILNYTTSSSSFNKFKKGLTIIDFFGTWCVPCIKALPHLTEVQQKYGKEVQILLVSNEEEPKLAKFINSRKGFSLPLIVDEGDVFTNLFQPPSYPYTVIIGSDGTILSITTEGGSIPDAAIAGWLNNKRDTVVYAAQKNTNQPQRQGMTNSRSKSANPVVQLSQDFMYAAKTGEAVTPFTERVANLNYEDLKKALTNDAAKKAFWINLYNGYTQVALKQNPEKYKNRKQFFTGKQFNISGKLVSLDDIEHGILRRSKIKWSLGYLGKLFPGKWEKGLRVTYVDPRIHFALNCGAKSCPPIAFYNPETIDKQLDLATKAYLTGEAEWDAKSNDLKLPAITGWFRGDFGGKKGMKKLVKKMGIIPEDANPHITFKKYDWTLYLNNYKTETE